MENVDLIVKAAVENVIATKVLIAAVNQMHVIVINQKMHVPVQNIKNRTVI